MYFCAKNIAITFSSEGKLTKPQIVRLIKQVIKMFKNEPNLVQIAEPICVVGDIHGQYADLVNMIGKIGDPGSNQNYCFLGDYVDRGLFGVEVCLLTFCMKLNFPKNVMLLRGNHEDRFVNKYLGLGKECAERLREDINDPNSAF